MTDSFFSTMSVDRSKWPRCLLWHGWLAGLSCDDVRSPWAASFGQLSCFELERCLGAHPVDRSGYWTPPSGMLTILLWRCRTILIFGRMVAGRIFLPLVIFKWLVLRCICLPLESPLRVLSGELLKSMGMLAWSVAVLLCLALAIWELITLMLPGLLAGCWIVTARQSLCLWLRIEIWSLLLSTMIRTRGRETVRD